MKRLVLTLLILLGASVAHASLANVYIADAAAGGDTGADCTNAHAKTFFNTAGNYGAGSTQIGSDTIVHVCGTITGALNANGLTFQGSGTSGHPITLLFESGASMQAPVWGTGNNSNPSATNGAIIASGKSFIVIDGGTNGYVENTANGTSGSSACPSGSCANQSDSTGVMFRNCNTCTVQNLQIINIYVRTSTADENNTGRGLSIEGSSSTNITFTNGIIHDANCGIFYDVLTGQNAASFVVSFSEFYNLSAGVNLGNGGSNGILAGFSFHDNKVHDFAAWNDSSPPYNFHHDGVHIWSEAGTSTTGVSAYNNEWYGDLGSGTAWFYVENYSHSTMDVLYFNNLWHDSATTCLFPCGPEVLWFQNGVSTDVIAAKIYGNSFVGSNTMACITVEGTTGIQYELINNTIGGCSTLLYVQSGAPLPLITSDYNNWSGLNGSHYIQNPGTGDAVSLATWQTKCSCDSHSSSTASGLTTPYVPLAGSPLIGTGVDQTSAGITALDADKAGHARPNGAPWDVGVYQYRPPSTAPQRLRLIRR